jgi:hypothetical protein
MLGALPAVLVSKPSSAGEFGDMFGAVNALFSGLAFAGVAYAIFLQQQALEIQREDTKKASGSNRRQLHIELQRMAMEDPDLQAVWGYSELETHTLRKQHAYINLVLSHWENDYVNGDLSEQKLKVVAGRYMKEHHLRAFWKRTREYRRSSAIADADALSLKFHNIVDALYLELKLEKDA